MIIASAAQASAAMATDVTESATGSSPHHACESDAMSEDTILADPSFLQWWRHLRNVSMLS